VHVRVLPREVDLLRGGVLLARIPQVLEVDLGTRCYDVGELNLGVEERGGAPGLGDGDACCRKFECKPYFFLTVRDADDMKIDEGSQW